MRSSSRVLAAIGVLLIGVFPIRPSSRASLVVLIVPDVEDARHKFFVSGAYSGAEAADIDRIDIYLSPESAPADLYFGGSASLLPDPAFSSFTTTFRTAPPGGRYTVLARAHNAVSLAETTFAGPTVTFSNGASQFAGSATPDLIAFEPATGNLRVWTMDGLRVAARPAFSDGTTRLSEADGWHVVGANDFSQDEKRPLSLAAAGGPDLLWQHDGGWLRLWRSDRYDPMNIRATTYLTPDHLDPAWHVEATADMNDDGWPDLVLRNGITGDLAVSIMDHSTVLFTATPDPGRIGDTNWKIVGVADFNHDLHPDLIWQHQTRGWLMLMTMNGLNMIESDYLNPWQVTDPGWKIRAVVDLNHDSWPDLVWQHATTNLSQVWFMRGSRLISSEYLSIDGSPFVPAGWEIVGPK